MSHNKHQKCSLAKSFKNTRIRLCGLQSSTSKILNITEHSKYKGERLQNNRIYKSIMLYVNIIIQMLYYPGSGQELLSAHIRQI